MDDDLVAKAHALTGLAEKSALVREALPRFAQAAATSEGLRERMFATLVQTMRESAIVTFPNPAGAPLSQALLSAPPKANQVAWVEADSDRLRVRVGEGTPDRATTPPAPAAPPSELARRPTRPIPGAP